MVNLLLAKSAKRNDQTLHPAITQLLHIVSSFLPSKDQHVALDFSKTLLTTMIKTDVHESDLTKNNSLFS